MFLGRYIRARRFSLVQEYTWFTLFLLLVIILASGLLLYQSFNRFKSERDLLLYQETQKLQMFVDERLTYVEHILQFIGNKINDEPDKSLEKVTRIIKHHRKNFQDDAFSWNMFSLVNPELLLVADSFGGIRDEPLQLNISKRSWLKKAKEDFWRIKFSEPDISLVSYEYVLPSGIAIPNKDRTGPIWYLAAGICIDRLTDRLLRIIDTSSSFIVMDEERNVVTSSEPVILAMKEKLPQWLDNYFFTPKIQKMGETLSLGKFDFFYAIKSEKYPFVILIGQDRKIYNHLLRNELLPRLAIYIGVGFTFALIMLFLGFQVIKPILVFGRSADAISKGNPVVIPKYPQKELRILGAQLDKLDVINKDLRYKQAQLAKMNTELQRANAFIKSNMSFLSHELTNPISSILGFAQLLRKKFAVSKDAETREFIEIIEKTAVHQHKQLSFFLKLFQFQEAPKKIEKKELDLKQVIEWNVSMVQHHIKNKNLTLEMNIEPDLKMMGDEIMIGQLIQNLATNAAKYNKPNGKIIINAHSRYTSQVAIEFIDTGLGIAKEDISKIFRKFTRIKGMEQKKTIGYGIGLAYSKRCALLHGGKITVKSKPGHGSTFCAILQKY